MKFPHPIPISELATRFHAQIIGDRTLQATGINEIHKVKSGDIVFADNAKYFQKSIHSAASIVFLNEVTDCPPGKALLIMDNPFAAYDALVREYRPPVVLRQNIHPSAQIDPSATIESNVIIANDVVIGKNSYIHAGAIIMEHTIIGENVTIQAGAIIGTDAFYYKKQPTGYQKWRAGGRVVIEDNVEIGAGCTINKGVSGDTRIGKGTKLDCQVHLGHGVVIGENCLLAAQVGIGGKTIVGDNCVLYGQVGIAQNLVIGDNVVLLAKTGVSKNLASNKTYFGVPATEATTKYRQLAALRQLPDLIRKWGNRK
ncbi:MAG: LpxD N-terminal domain-containing protein [Saprospiraceae bacterium]